MLIAYIVIALFISWVWVDYYRLIDVYERDSLKYFILAFLFGATSVVFVFAAHLFLLDDLGWHLNGEWLNDLLYCTFQIGLLEEISKFIPFLILVKILPKVIDEPLDYISFGATTALGFAAVENVMYFSQHGAEIISGRAVLSVIGHMTWSGFVAYGLMRRTFKFPNPSIFEFFGFLLLAAFAHGLFDFALMYPGFSMYRGFGYFISVLFYFLGISVFATMMNNALNNSPFFHYKHSISSWKIASRIVLYYLVIFIASAVIVGVDLGQDRMIFAILTNIFITGSIIAVVAIRLSRFRLVRGRWNQLRLELPLNYRKPLFSGRDNIRGDSPIEMEINSLIGSSCQIQPLSRRNKYLKYPGKVVITDKVFLDENDAMYVAHLYRSTHSEIFELVLLAPNFKTSFVADKHPIVGIYKVDGAINLNESNKLHRSFPFKDWAVLVKGSAE